MRTHIKHVVFFACATLVTFVFSTSLVLANPTNAFPDPTKKRNDLFLDKIQPILNARCVTCHACYQGPCQLNLQSYEEIRRGFNPTPLYSGSRIRAVPPSRLTDPPQGFYPVLPQKQGEQSLFALFLEQGSKNISGETRKESFSIESAKKIQEDYNKTSKHQCVATSAQMETIFKKGQNPWEVVSFDEFIEHHKQAGMPLGLPKLTKEEQNTITDWIKAGAPGPSKEAQASLVASSNPKTISAWERFLNTNSAQGRHTSRFFYEHLFSAIIYLEETPGEYYQLVRSRTPSPLPINRINTELPYELPQDIQASEVFYRLEKVTRTLVQKTQNIWRVNANTLARLQTQFHGNWGPTQIPEPIYGSNNPFLYFAPIPAHIRSRFLQENSRVIIGAMVQGTVCVGSSATYAIADHFWVWFLKPESDPSVRKPTLGLPVDTLATAPQPPREELGKVAKWAENLKATFSNTHSSQIVQHFMNHKGLGKQIFPGLSSFKNTENELLSSVVQEIRQAGGTVFDVAETLHHFFRTIKANQEYQEAFERELRILLKQNGRESLDFRDLWDGTGDPNYPHNPNAWINVTRHEKNATVQWGTEGGFPQSAWILSYSNFERLYYDLVASFKVWGSLPHKMATWRHMSYVRLEGEDLFISFFPVEHREAIRRRFTHGVGGLANDVFFPLWSTKQISLPNVSESIRERISHFFRSNTLPPRQAPLVFRGNTPLHSVRTFWDLIKVNREFQQVTQIALQNEDLVTEEQKNWDRGLFALQKRFDTPELPRPTFPPFLPNVSYVRVEGPHSQNWVYSLVANRGYRSHTFVFLENLTRDPSQDTLSVYRGFVGAYPEMFFDVKRENLNNFVNELQNIQSQRDWEVFRDHYGTPRNTNAFWPMLDWFHSWKSARHPGVDPVEQGVIDLSEYQFY